MYTVKNTNVKIVQCGKDIVHDVVTTDDDEFSQVRVNRYLCHIFIFTIFTECRNLFCTYLHMKSQNKVTLVSVVSYFLFK